MSELEQLTWRDCLDDYAKKKELTHKQKMYLKKAISAGRSQSKIPEILRVGRAVRHEKNNQQKLHEQHKHIQKLEQEIASLKDEVEKTRSEYDQYRSSIMDTPPRGPCFDKFDYDARGISERNQDIINKFKDLFIGHYIYIYTYKGVLQYKISERYYPGYGEDFKGWDYLGDLDDWPCPDCDGTNRICLEILSKIGEIRKKKSNKILKPVGTKRILKGHALVVTGGVYESGKKKGQQITRKEAIYEDVVLYREPSSLYYKIGDNIIYTNVDGVSYLR